MDITIYGAGVFGLSIAWVCRQRGARVQVIDPAGPGAGASGGVLGALSPHSPDGWNPKKQFQLESLIMAETFWAEVEAVAAQPSGYGRIGRLQPVASERSLALAQKRAEAAQQNWPERFRWTIQPASDWPALSGLGADYVVCDTLSARLDPARAITALTEALRRQGVGIHNAGHASGLIVHATGHAGLEALSAETGREWGRAEKGQAARLALALPDLPQLYVDNLHIVPQADGSTAVGSTSERDFEHVAPDAKLEALIEKAGTILPALRQAEVIRRWAGLRPRSVTRAPLLGAWPDRPGHFIANGGFKTGFGMAPKLAHLLADLLLDDQDHIPATMRPDQI